MALGSGIDEDDRAFGPAGSGVVGLRLQIGSGIAEDDRALGSAGSFVFCDDGDDDGRIAPLGR
jgi:hypothetical protein